MTVGGGTGQIWLDNVGCRGNESTLASCPHPAFGTHNCNHNEDAGVTCNPAGKLLDTDQLVWAVLVKCVLPLNSLY